MKKLTWGLILLIVVGAGGAVFYANRGDKESQVTTLKVTRGDLVDAVSATGTLQAVITVTVGSQVSGIVSELDADFNSIVKKDQILAKLDPALLQTALETAKANLTNAQANLEKQKAAVEDATTKLRRMKDLYDRQLETKADLDAADATAKQAIATQKSMESGIVQAQAAVDKAQVDLDHTVITAPIDGIVIKRSVDRGQTVAASMAAPEMFIIAADLTKMQVNANIDESDVGRMRPGQTVTFRVDAYPTDVFHGSVNQVRLNPTTVQNVVTYSTIIDVPNPDLKLKPGMTANLQVEIARRSNVLRVPNAALRFRPTKDIFDALKQPMPEGLDRGGRRGQNAQGGPGAGGFVGGPGGSGSRGGGPANPEFGYGQPGAGPGQAQATAQGNQHPQNAQGQNAKSAQGGQNAKNAPGGQNAPGQNAQNGQNAQGGQGGGRGDFANMTPEERQKRMQERLAKMTPEERAAFEQRRAERMAQGGNGGGRGGNFPGGGQGNFGGGQGNFSGRGNFAGNRSGNPAQPNNSSNANGPGTNAPANLTETKAATIDSLFGPLPAVETRGRAWLYVDKQLKMVNLRLGITDGTNTEVLNDTALTDGQEVVINVLTPDMLAKPGSAANNPLMPQRGRGGPGGGRGPGR